MIVRLHHISLGVKDLAQSSQFYRDFLDFVIIPRPDLGFPGIWLQLNGLQLHLIQRDEQYLKSALPRAIHYAFHVASVSELDEKAATLSQRNWPFSKTTQKGSGIQQIFFIDPNNYNIELGFYPDTSN